MVSFGASDMNLTVVIEENQITEAVSRLHLEFFDSIESSEIFEARNE
jgi:aspartokinase